MEQRIQQFGFYGNASIEDMERQIRTIIEGESIKETDRFNVHFARMGEPTWNENVLAFGLALKGIAKSAGLVAKTIHPVVSTMLPKANSKLPTDLVQYQERILQWRSGFTAFN